ncbi:MAG: sugar phosphate nucleotidyltransferase, partial [bacterium]|nr:sugar phosphate nucleotidyltransferase [bacterium]
VEKEPLGTGGAIKAAAAGIDETFLVINGDNLADFNWTTALDLHKKSQAEVTLSLFPVEDVTQYGIARLKDGRVLEFVEKPTVEQAPSNLNNAGGYVMEPTALSILPDGMCSIERDCFEKIAPLGKVFAHLHSGQWYPTDTIQKYNHADKNFEPNN